MDNKKIVKNIMLNLLVIFINIFVFSKAFLGVQIAAADVFEAILGIATILASIVLFVFININLKKFKKVKTIITPGRSDINTLDDWYEELRKYENKQSAFEKNLAALTEQIVRYKKKKRIINKILSEKFDTGEITYHKFNNTVENVEKLFQENIANAATQIRAFDEADITVSQKEILREYNKFISKMTSDNECIIMKLDNLIFEISKLKDMSNDDIKSLDAIKEMEQLIQNTKLYK